MTTPAVVTPGTTQQLIAYPGAQIQIVAAEPPPPPPAPVAVGAYRPGAYPSAFAASFGRQPAIWHEFVPITDTTPQERVNRALFDAAWANAAVAAGAIPLFTHELRDYTVAMRVAQPTWTLDRWISGANDANLVRWLTAAGAWGKRFLYRVGWEMTGWDYTWAVNFAGNSCGKYVDFWQHVIRLQRRYAPLGESVWCPSVLLPANAALTPMSWCYPGPDWVRWVGLDGYVSGNVSASGPNRPFYDVFADSVAEVARFAPGKGVIICETGVNPADPTIDSAAWLLGIPAALAKLPAVRGLCFFDSRQSVIRNDPQRAAVATILADPLLQGQL